MRARYTSEQMRKMAQAAQDAVVDDSGGSEQFAATAAMLRQAADDAEARRHDPDGFAAWADALATAARYGLGPMALAWRTGREVFREQMLRTYGAEYVALQALARRQESLLDLRS